MSDKQFEETTLSMYFNNGSKDYTYFRFPVTSDAPKMMFIKFRKYSNDEVVNRLYQVFLQEKARIADVTSRESKIASGEIQPIKNYDNEKSKKFLFFPYFNESKNYRLVASNNEKAIKDKILEYVTEQADNDFNRLTKLEVVGEKAKQDFRIKKSYGNEKVFHLNYYLNSVLANSQMQSLFSGDLAFYKADKSARSIISRTVDAQKRNKQNTSPALS